ncbi:MAG: glucose 1-dehydrogenase [Pseudomonadota bacterium]
MLLKDKVAIITGGGRGIGRAIALRYAKEGAKVVIAEIVKENAEKVAREIKDAGGEALALRTDVSSEKDTVEMARKTVDHFGRIDVLVNNAAIFYGLPLKLFEEITVEEWDRVMAVNVKGVWLCSKAVVSQMKAQRKGKIINLSSGTFLAGFTLLCHYTASKGAVIGIARVLANELGEFGINVNAVSPAFTMSEAGLRMAGENPGMKEGCAQLQCFKRSCETDDLMGTFVFLASDDSDFVTGQTLECDGGQVCW